MFLKVGITMKFYLCPLSHDLPFYFFTIPTRLEHSRIYPHIPVLLVSPQPQDSTETFFRHSIIKTDVLLLIFTFLYHCTASTQTETAFTCSHRRQSRMTLSKPSEVGGVSLLLQMRKHTSSAVPEITNRSSGKQTQSI